MSKQLVAKAEFARLAGVTPAAVTKALLGKLGAAKHANRIDKAHPAAVAYLKKHDDNATKNGLDPLYHQAVERCQTADKYSQRFIRESFGIGTRRAKVIYDTMVAAGVIVVVKKTASVGYKTVNGPANATEGPVASVASVPPPPPSPLDCTPVPFMNDQVPPPPAPGELVIDVPDDIKEFMQWTLQDILEKFRTHTAFQDWLKSTQTIAAINEKHLKNATTEGTLVARDLVRVGIIEPIEAAHLQLMSDGAKSIATRVCAMHDAERTQAEKEKFVHDQIASFIRPLKKRVARIMAHA